MLPQFDLSFYSLYYIVLDFNSFISDDVWSLGCIFGFVVSSGHLFAQYGKTPLENITDFIGMPPKYSSS